MLTNIEYNFVKWFIPSILKLMNNKNISFYCTLNLNFFLLIFLGIWLFK